MKKLLAFIAITAMTLTTQAVTVNLDTTNSVWNLGYTTNAVTHGSTLDIASLIDHGGTLSMMIKVNELPNNGFMFLKGNYVDYCGFKVDSFGDLNNSGGGGWLLSSGEYLKKGDTFALSLVFHDNGTYDIYFNGELKRSGLETRNIAGSESTEQVFYTSGDGANLEYEFVGMSSNPQGSTVGVPEPTAMALLLMGVAAVGLRRKAKQVA